MSHKRRLLLSLSVFFVFGTVFFVQQQLQSAPPVHSLQASPAARWYRGNLHTHSLWSDGDDYPEMIARWYQQHDYDFLSFSDHNILQTVERWTNVDKNKGKRVAYDKLIATYPDWTEQREVDGRTEVRLKKFDELSQRFNSPEKFLLVRGEEITDRFKNLPVHMNASNIQTLIPPLGGESVYDVMQNNVNAVISQRERTKEPIMIHLNHPNFGYGVTAEDLMRVHGENFFEVYNGHPGVNDSGDAKHASTERIWDIILTRRLAEFDMPLMYGLATDDGHSYHKIPSRASEPGRGWVMVLADELSARSLVEAMESGRFYSSSGVNLRSVKWSTNGIRIEIEPSAGVEYRIDFIGTLDGYDADSSPVVDKSGKPLPVTRTYSDSIGQVLQSMTGTTASYEFSGTEIYVRAVVTSTQQHPNPSEQGEFERAWIQPIKGPAAP